MNQEYTVTSLNQYIKSVFDRDFRLKGIRLEGEISNFKKYPSGHIYFTLKDENSMIKAVMFAGYTKYISSPIKDGDKVTCLGYVDVYVTRGEYQFYAEAIELAGKGDILLELEKLKKKLAAEGLFDESHKRKINLFPKAVGVICAPKSAAMADIMTNLVRRNPLISVYPFPAQVQGEGSVESIKEALAKASEAPIDTLIIGRGGGASEDLWSFNDEGIVRLIYSFKCPVISAVGHEIDYTLVDYVSDARASTPTGACELATIDKREIYETLNRYEMRLDEAIEGLLRELTNRLDNLATRKVFKSPKEIYETKIEKLNTLEHDIDLLINKYLDGIKSKTSYLESHLEALSPNKVLERGYSLVTSKTGKVIKSKTDVALDDNLVVNLKDGKIVTRVIEK